MDSDVEVDTGAVVKSANERIADSLERLAVVAEEVMKPRLVVTKTDPCELHGHSWRQPMFYERDRKPYCTRCGLETHS